MTPEELFAQWYAQYPIKKAIGYARKCWLKQHKLGLITEAMLPDMLKTLEWQKREWAERGDPNFIPHPSTYINQERWADEPIAKAVAPVCPRFTGMDDYIRLCERIWHNNPGWTKAQCEEEAQRRTHARQHREPGNITSLSDVLRKVGQ